MLSNTLATAIVCMVLALIVCGAIAVLVRDKKNGKSACGGNCGKCAMHGHCHGGEVQQ
ncbi:MAG: FeoB-associated Cys-rich membrane protein [Oscillospiraceae bacterium]|nr:FeoB-associated Cys-rich membrane protein [Oscillospiraceae bacterium]